MVSTGRSLVIDCCFSFGSWKKVGEGERGGYHIMILHD
jgi:hypothetical protein